MVSWKTGTPYHVLIDEEKTPPLVLEYLTEMARIEGLGRDDYKG